ncbi:MAG: hypothetical protein SGI86_20320 [Deltaproteobacteria bacterium]|nr:hypothetical protein [Deltaproteobacteria bacterium]
MMRQNRLRKTTGGAFSAYLYTYTPTAGGCNPGVAEYVIVLSQRRPGVN